MSFLFSQTHAERVKEMFTKLTNTKSDESHFLEIENIFFEVIGIARIYGNDVNDNKFLADLKRLETNDYRLVQNRALTRKNREAMIRKLKNSLKQILQKRLKQPGEIL